MPSQNESILYRKSHPNRTTFKNMGEMVFGKRERIWGSGNLKKKCKLHKCHPKMIICRKFHPNQTMGKCYKIRGKFQEVGEEFGEGDGGAEFQIKKCKPRKCHLKINLCKKFHPNRITGKGSKIVGRLENVTN